MGFGKPILLRAFLAIQGVQRVVHAQAAQCSSLAGGCDQGTAGLAALQNAISSFQDGFAYGGGEPIVFSSSVSNGVLAQIAYSCENGSVPPVLAGSTIRTL
jgi:hypothetical protein